MSKEFARIESVTRWPLYEFFTIRVWRDETSSHYEDNSDIGRMIELGIKQQKGVIQIAKDVAKMPRVSAVEWVERSGNGYVYYQEQE